MLSRIHMFNFDVQNIDKYPRFKVGNYERISKYKNISAKSYKLNWSEELFVIKSLKNHGHF